MKLQDIPICDVLRDYADLDVSPHGDRVGVKCPFHDGKSGSSLSIYVESNSAYCFGGCGYIDNEWIVSKRMEIPQQEARRELMQRYNISGLTAQEEQEIRKFDLLHKYVEYCSPRMQAEHDIALKARAIETDGIPFGLHTENLEMTEEELACIGIIPQFCGKIILPCYLNKKLIYVIGWNWNNTPDCPKYVKPSGWNVPIIGEYGGENTLIVEGYFDQLSAQQAGFSAVSPISDTVTKTQKEWLKNKGSFIVCFDNDKSGREAQEQLSSDLFPAVRDGDVNHLGDCKDLNELLCSVGQERFREIVGVIIGTAQDALRINLKRLNDLITNHEERKAAIAVYSDVMPLIILLPHGLQEFELKSLSKIITKPLGITLESLRSYIKTETKKKEAEPDQCPDEKESLEPLALFPGLVDIVAVETILEKNGETFIETMPAFLIMTETGELTTATTYKVNGTTVCPPELDQIPWLLPREPEVRRHFQSDDDRSLCEDMLAFFRNNSDMPNVNYYILELAWVLHTYFLEQIQYSPYLHHYAIWERGKSRTLKGMIWMANRGLLVESLNPAYIVRMAAYWRASLAIDVLELWKKAENSEAVDILMNRFEAGGKVPRVMYPEKGRLKDIVYFEIFGPTLIATNVPVGEGLSTRSIQINMPESPRMFETKVKEVDLLPFKERLIALRARHLYDPLPECSKPALCRLGDITWPLLQVLHLICPEYIPQFEALIAELEAARCKATSMSIEAEIVEAIVSIKKSDETVFYDGIECVVINDIATIINDGKNDKERLSNKSIGNKLKAMGIHPYKKEPGTKRALYYYTTNIIELLLRRYGLEEKAPQSIAPPSFSEDSQNSQNSQSVAAALTNPGSFKNGSETEAPKIPGYGSLSSTLENKAPKNTPHGYEDRNHWEHRELPQEVRKSTEGEIYSERLIGAADNEPLPKEILLLPEEEGCPF